MNYRGRALDPVLLWEKYVSFPENFRIDGEFLPKVTCPNPDHDTLKRHFQINVSQPTVHCFANCGISGSYEHAVCLTEGLYDKFKVEESSSDRERKERIRRARLAAQKIILRNASGKPARLDRPVARRRNSNHRRADQPLRSPDALEYATYIPSAGQKWLEQRGISESSISQWEIGWDSTDLRIVIPAKDFDGKLKFLIRRATRPKDQPKYLYTEGFPKTSLLFGACMLDLKAVRSEGMVLVEGSIDTIINQQNGIQTGGILGTGISEAQCRIIARARPKRIYLMFDRDLAGVHNIEIAAKKLRQYPLYVCRYPKGKYDPAEFVREEAMKSIEKAVPLVKWMSKNFPNANRERRMVLSG